MIAPYTQSHAITEMSGIIMKSTDVQQHLKISAFVIQQNI